ncbi:hypothetical protein LEP1GSC052_0264 [Leptospira kmetyi serovar Malaysia str. Bejo-Iso9]|nr:hypothetical protein LEP1GSC052_0264 [Leptospira kmetyi serovar Malaysia str. Bejo-Iso9]
MIVSIFESSLFANFFSFSDSRNETGLVFKIKKFLAVKI